MPDRTMGPLVVDANILFACLIRDGPTRELVLDAGLDLCAPEWLWEEVAARYDWLLERSRLSRPTLDVLLRALRDRITDIPAGLIEQQREEALRLAVLPGRKDAPYIAAALAVDGILWTHDRRLAAACKGPVVTTAELVK